MDRARNGTGDRCHVKPARFLSRFFHDTKTVGGGGVRTDDVAVEAGGDEDGEFHFSRIKMHGSS